MRLILSRKGFDSQFGGVPSPILPDGSLCSLPIPSRDARRFADVHWNDSSFGEIVGDLTGGRLGSAHHTHLDPDLHRDALPRISGWLPSFGQTAQAQTHLENEHVGRNDLFLFFGWFRQTRYHRGRLMYEPKAPHLHVIFGWLQVGEIFKPTQDVSPLPAWSHDHPHVAGADERESNNTLYVATDHLNVKGLPRSISGGGAFPRFVEPLCLTADGKSRSIWNLSSFFYPDEGKPPLSHHCDLTRWKRNDRGVTLKTVARGQEFVLDCAFYPGVTDWLQELFACLP